jgi:hypothetical protein
VIAEQRAWRAARRSSRWKAPSWPDRAGQQPAALEPGQIAGIYRVLRKGREDNNDEPGAADFYYGEMEMRRRARPGGNPDGQSGTECHADQPGPAPERRLRVRLRPTGGSRLVPAGSCRAVRVAASALGGSQT